MEYGKYIIVKCRGHEVAITFDSLISHCDIGTEGGSSGKAISAGFFVVGGEPSEHDPDNISVSVFGKSVTLKLGVRVNQDEWLIKRVLRKDSL